MKKIIPLSVIITLLFTSCHTSNNRESEKYGGTLRVNINDIPELVFPGEIEKRSEQIIVNQVYCGLVKYHTRTLEIIPSIAKIYNISGDGLTYTFLLDSRARFQDDACFPKGKGRHIVSSDIKYSIEQICRNKLKSDRPVPQQITNIAGSEDFMSMAKLNETASISGIEAENDSVLVIRLNEPDDLFIHFLASTNALIFPHEAYGAYGTNSTVGSGPFCMKYPQSQGLPIELTYNSGYWKQSKQKEQLPYIDSLIFSFVTSTQKELYLFSTGKINIVFDLPTAYLSTFLESNIEGFQSNPPLYIMTNTINPNNDKRFNLQTSDVNGLYINSQNYFDFAEVYLKEPKPHKIVVNED